ncbi:TetR family transcriptional regulator [Alteromonas facilis]|uniref:TetR family transcriptional regulator n=1 Tax=Alteromonas facilis TaxID=2048004 RepID=UPI000C28D2C8|nr:TetR family transcriptional regulator [Alteromonas facilis]
MAKSAPRNREKTHNKIRMAIVRLEQGRPNVVKPERKMSVAAVAEEAGVSRTLIMNQYPDLLERIRGGANKHIQKQRDEKYEALKKEREKNRELRSTLADVMQKYQVMVSRNATLEMENRRLTGIVENENVTVFRGKIKN